MTTQRPAPLVIMGEQLCEAVDLRSSQKVLDVATAAVTTGSGSTAISATRRFCKTTGLDYVPELLEQAKDSSGLFGAGYRDCHPVLIITTLQSNPRSMVSLQNEVCRPPERLVSDVSGAGTLLGSLLGPTAVSLSL